MKRLLIFLVLLPFFAYPQSKQKSWIEYQSMVSQILRDSASIVIPEHYGVTGDGVTDDADAISSVINNNLGKTILFTHTYNIDSKVFVDLDDNNITLVFAPQSKLVATTQNSEGNIYYPDAIFRLTNGKDVIVYGLEIEAYNTGVTPGLTYNGLYINTNDDTANFLCAFKIDSTERVHLENVRASNAIYAGLFMSDIDDLYADNCVADSNYYAGMIVRRTKHAVINGGEYSNNGVRMSYGGSPYSAGYGLEFGNAFSDTYGRYNQEITVTGVKAFYNVRKGIGTHQAFNYTIIGNHVKGFGVVGIDGVNQGYEQYVKNVNISDNTVEQDSAWYVNNNLIHSSFIGIQTGTYAGINDQTNYPIENIIISRNNLNNIGSSYGSDGIQLFSSYADNIQITNNTISNSTFKQCAIGIYSGNDKGGQPTNVLISGNTLSNITVSGATDNNESGIFITAGKQITISNNIIDAIIATDTTNAGIKVFEYGAGSTISAVKINSNFIGGTLRNGIYLYGIASLTANDNLLDGTFTDYYIYSTPEAEQVMLNNSVKDLYAITSASTPQSNLLPDILGNGIGRATYVGQLASSTSVALNTISLDMLRYGDITASFNIRVHVATSSNQVIGYADYYAYAGNADSVTAYGVDTLETVQYVNTSISDFEDFIPSVGWITSGNEATLRFTFPTAYTGYKIDINFNSRLAVIYQKP